jgi:hypothetical protein
MSMQEPIRQTFPLDEPPTLPQRTSSGGVIKVGVIRAMAEVHTATKGAIAKLDALIDLALSMPPAKSMRPKAR